MNMEMKSKLITKTLSPEEQEHYFDNFHYKNVQIYIKILE